MGFRERNTLKTQSLLDRLRAAQPGQARTLLCIGPMSSTCVRAAGELAERYPQHPLTLIASRRQVEGTEMGGGYVEGWTPESFAAFARKCSKRLILARDHGGPWQHDGEKHFSLDQAMASAKASFLRDLEVGFDQLHVDPSRGRSGPASREESLERAFELYEYCVTQARRLGRDVILEVGTDEQSDIPETPEAVRETIGSFERFCESHSLPTPAFVVAQTGTKVLETDNVGQADFTPDGAVARIVKVCNRSGVFLKEHNADYLPLRALREHPRIGVHAMNVAPQFGVEESRALLSRFDKRAGERFLEIAFESRKWEKWLKKESPITDEQKAILCGHYVFSHPEVQELRRGLKPRDHEAILVHVRGAMESVLEALDPTISTRERSAA